MLPHRQRSTTTIHSFNQASLGRQHPSHGNMHLPLAKRRYSEGGPPIPWPRGGPPPDEICPDLIVSLRANPVDQKLQTAQTRGYQSPMTPQSVLDTRSSISDHIESSLWSFLLTNTKLTTRTFLFNNENRNGVVTIFKSEFKSGWVRPASVPLRRGASHL